MLSKQGRLFSIVVLLSITTLSTTTGRAGTALTMSPATQDVPRVELLADGTKNPASISDEVALRVLFLTTDVSSNATATNTTRLRAKLSRMHLDESDLTVLMQRLSGLRETVAPQRARIVAAREAVKRNPTAAAFANVIALDRQLDTMAADTYRELLLSLSPEGAGKLREHVAHVKTTIKIIPPPNMTPTQHH